ncbi:hypothetical protein [Bradyrhizobium liaoningense]|uniref:hypothetical protein n=1 Tax=Bradyrhizobium liaoningense TaxID=43992 RepID=UPI001BABE07F|nr:hypothetical protein [Bradyrhizobium liaoningense]
MFLLPSPLAMAPAPVALLKLLLPLALALLPVAILELLWPLALAPVPVAELLLPLPSAEADGPQAKLLAEPAAVAPCSDAAPSTHTNCARASGPPAQAAITAMNAVARKAVAGARDEIVMFVPHSRLPNSQPARRGRMKTAVTSSPSLPLRQRD